MTPVRRVRGFATLAVVLVAAVSLAGCKVDARVDVTLNSDGTGIVVARVTLDKEALRRLTREAPSRHLVPLEDIRGVGWKVSAWTPVGHGGEEISFTHDFVDQRDLAQRLADLAGPKGVLGGAAITRTRGWWSQLDSISVSVDLRHVAAGVRSDAPLAARLRAAGIDLNTLDAQLRSQLNQDFMITLDVHAPGGETNIVELTAGNRATVTASTARTYTRKITFLAVGAGLLLLALVITAVILVTRSRRRRAS